MTSVTTDQLARSEVKAVVAAVEAIFSTIISETPALESGYPTDEIMTCNGIIGSISLVGGVEWSVLVYLDEETAPKLAERFTGFEIPYASEDMGDTIGELANLLAGEIKVELDRVGIKANISLPQVYRGRGIEVLAPGHTEPLLFVFSSSCGPISLAVLSSKS